MKKILSVMLALTMLAATCVLCVLSPVGASAEAETVVVDGTATWKYLKGAVGTTAPEGWLKGECTDWTESTLPISFGYDHFECYATTTFTLDDALRFGKMVLSAKYDEDPHVYLNGTEIWSASSYYDAGFLTYDLSRYSNLLQQNNVLCVYFRNVNGGSVMDLSLTMTVTNDANGYLLPSGASCANVYDFGDINKPENVFDFNNTTVCGSGFNVVNNQEITVTYSEVYDIGEIFIDCQDEGTTTHGDGVTRGTYDLYARYLGVWSKVASDVKAQPAGVTVKLDGAYKADAIKAVITSWQGDKWACVADMAAKTAKGDYLYAVEDVDGKLVVHGVTSAGFAGSGSVNAPANVLDGDNGSVCGSGYNSTVEQCVTLSFAGEATVGSVYISCKKEGDPASGCWGTYDLYAINDGVTYKIAEGVEAWPEGRNVVLEKSYEAEQLKAVITSWNGSAWAAIAELHVAGAEETLPAAGRDAIGTPVVKDYAEKLTYDHGDVNAVRNMLDGNPSTMWGTNWNPNVEISVQLNYAGTVLVESIEVYAMNENNAPADGGAWGKYDVYAIVEGETVLVAEGVEAWPEGYTGAPANAGLVTLEEPMKIEGVKVVVTEWKVAQWAGIATMNVNTVLPRGDVNGDLSVSIKDVSKLLTVIAGKPTVLDTDALLDLDDSGVVSIGDVTKLLNMLAGK